MKQFTKSKSMKNETFCENSKVSYWNKTIEDENILQNECKCISRKNSISSVILCDKKDEEHPNTAILSSNPTVLTTTLISSRCQSSNTIRRSYYSRAPMLKYSDEVCNHRSFDIYHPKYIVRPLIPTRSFSLHKHYYCQSPDTFLRRPSFKSHCKKCCPYSNKQQSVNIKLPNWYDNPVPINNLQMEDTKGNLKKYEKKNGEVQIEASNQLDQDSIVRDTGKGSIITRKVKRRKSGYGIAITRGISCDLTNQNNEKSLYINSNGRVLVKGATLDDASSPRVSSVSCQCHTMQMSHNSNCDWSISHGNLIELSNRLHPQSNQIAQII